MREGVRLLTGRPPFHGRLPLVHVRDEGPVKAC